MLQFYLDFKALENTTFHNTGHFRYSYIQNACVLQKDEHPVLWTEPL